jgi:uncharacterized cupredoxin-like copper-binding protein
MRFAQRIRPCLHGRVALAAAVGGCLALLPLFTSCGADRALVAATPVLRVGERDFKIDAPRRVRTGRVLLEVTNKGPDSHELLVVRARGRLPLRPDGLTVDEEGIERDVLATVEPRGPGHVTELRLRLSPGRYVLLCNMAGHYLGGMHRTLVVR